MKSFVKKLSCILPKVKSASSLSAPRTTLALADPGPVEQQW